MNNVSLLGRLVRDPELRQTGGGKSVLSFTLAVDGAKDKADFIPCVAWEKTAEFIHQHMAKGQRIGLVGRLQSRNYEDKEGNKRSVLEVITSGVYFADGKRDDYKSAFVDVDDDGELPF